MDSVLQLVIAACDIASERGQYDSNGPGGATRYVINTCNSPFPNSCAEPMTQEQIYAFIVSYPGVVYLNPEDGLYRMSRPVPRVPFKAPPGYMLTRTRSSADSRVAGAAPPYKMPPPERPRGSKRKRDDDAQVSVESSKSSK